MSWIFVAVGGHLLNAIAFIVDKTLLTQSFKRSGTYAATIGIFSALALVLAPWAMLPQDAEVWAAIAVFGISFVIAMWGFFEALSKAETSRVVPVVGSLIPILTLALAMPLVGERLSGTAFIGFVFLVTATLILTRGGDRSRRLDHRTFWLCAGSSLLFAVSSIAGKYAFGRMPFVDVFFWSRLFAAATAFAIPVLSKPVREELAGLFRPSKAAKGGIPKSVFLMIFGQACGALGFVGVQYAISLGSATVVNALQAVQYAAIVLAAWIGGAKLASLLKEERTTSALVHKGGAIVLVALGLALVSFVPKPVTTTYGFTWSDPYARELGLDPVAGFDRALNELHPQHLRLMAYWSEIEAKKGSFDFTALDRQLDAAERAGVPVTLAVGARLPRWPECWTPDWVTNMTDAQRTSVQIEFLKEVYRHEEDRKGIAAWQIENEPELHSFRSCPGLTKELVTQELRWVRGEEAKRAVARPVGTTDSGELSFWLHFPGETDELGVSVYRVVSNPLFGTVQWILPADFYADKGYLVSRFTGPVYVSEFQMEPWFNQPLTKTPVQSQLDQFTTERMTKNFEYAMRLNVPLVDFWGVEWWLWMDQLGHPEYWQTAKGFFASPR
jgi:drug/metabolite transporter (DMT)-like permease